MPQTTRTGADVPANIFTTGPSGTGRRMHTGSMIPLTSYVDGYASGFSAGTTSGYASGLADGTAAGYASGLADGETAGYAEGLADGRATAGAEQQSLLVAGGGTVYEIVQGNLEPDLRFQCTVLGQPEDVSDATSFVLLWLRPDGTTTTVSLVAIDLSAGLVKRVWVAGDTSVIGLHRGRVLVTRGNAEPQTFPSDGSWFRWRVNEAPF